MGRNAGWIAVHSGIAGGADVILIPEIPYDTSKVAHTVMTRERLGKHFTIIVSPKVRSRQVACPKSPKQQ